MPTMSNDPIAGFRFAVEIGSETVGAFTECQMPGFSVKTEPIQEGGQNNYKHELPGYLDIGHVTLKHGLVANDTLLNWYLQILTNGFSPNALKTVTITTFTNDFQPLYRFNVAGAYPVKWEGPQFRAGESAAAIESIELTHHGITIQSLPVSPVTVSLSAGVNLSLSAGASVSASAGIAGVSVSASLDIGLD